MGDDRRRARQWAGHERNEHRLVTARHLGDQPTHHGDTDARRDERLRYVVVGLRGSNSCSSDGSGRGVPSPSLAISTMSRSASSSRASRASALVQDAAERRQPDAARRAVEQCDAEFALSRLTWGETPDCAEASERAAAMIEP
jgi:hypothetical protein